jgi:cytosine deaminase
VTEPGLLVTDGRTLDGSRVDVAIDGRSVADIAPAGTLSEGGRRVYDADGQLVTPTFAEPHTHLDMALVAGQPRWNETGTLADGIDLWHEYKRDLDADELRARAERAVRWFVAHGVTRIRTHVDTTEASLTGVRTLRSVAASMDDIVDIQLVAFPQDGLLTDPTHERRLVEALELGADAVGGIPHFERTADDGVTSIRTAFDLAEAHDCAVDLHIDETDDPESRLTATLASEARDRGLGERTTASHATAMHSYPNAYADKLARLLADSGVSVVTNPLDNAVLQGRHDDYPRRRGHTRIDELHEAGVPVGIGHDSVMDPVYHYGQADPLDAAYVLLHLAHMSGRADVATIWAMLTRANASIVGADPRGLVEGAPGSLVVFDATDPFDALRRRAARRLVVREGTVVARTDPATATVVRDGTDRPVSFR